MNASRPTVRADVLPDDVISLPQMAQLLGISPSSAWRWMRAGLVRAWRIGVRWRVSRAEVLALISCNEPRPEVAARAEREAELQETDRILREAGVRR